MMWLPDELLLMILENAADDLDHLKSLSLVNRFFYTETRPYLFASVWLDKSFEDSVERLAICSQAHLSKYAFELTIEGQAIVPQEMLDKCPQNFDEILKNIERNLAGGVDATVDHTMMRTFELLLPPYAEQFLTSLIRFFNSTKDNLEIIHLTMASMAFASFFPSNSFHCALNESVNIALGQVKMAAMDSISMDHLTLNRTKDLFNGSATFFSKDVSQHLSLATLKNNLDQIQSLNLEYGIWHDPDLRTVAREEGFDYLRLVTSTFPALCALDLHLPTNGLGLDISPVSTLPLEYLSLRGMTIRNLLYVLEQNPKIEEITLEFVQLPGDEFSSNPNADGEIHWAEIFEQLMKMPISMLQLRHLGYFEYVVEDSAQPCASRKDLSTLLCTPYARDVSAAKEMLDVLGFEEQRVCLHEVGSDENKNAQL